MSGSTVAQLENTISQLKAKMQPSASPNPARNGNFIKCFVFDMTKIVYASAIRFDLGYLYIILQL